MVSVGLDCPKADTHGASAAWKSVTCGYPRRGPSKPVWRHPQPRVNWPLVRCVALLCEARDGCLAALTGLFEAGLWGRGLDDFEAPIGCGLKLHHDGLWLA
jgi:hypothetical protein